MPREADLQRKIMQWCTHQKLWCEKRHGSVFGHRGMPDLFILVQTPRSSFAVPLFVELKAPGKTPTKLQQAMQRQLNDAGAYAITVTTLEEVVGTVRALRES